MTYGAKLIVRNDRLLTLDEITPIGIFGPPFMYFGAKFRIANRFGEPQKPMIIEPFCGAAGYSLYWSMIGWRGDVWLNDLDADIAAIWEWLIAATPDDIKSLPEGFDDKMKGSVPRGAFALMRSWAGAYPAGTKKMDEGGIDEAKNRSWQMRSRLTPRNIGWSRKQMEMRLLFIARIVKHWRVTKMNYADLPDEDAHWFIDPPYQGMTRRAYRHDSEEIDFEHLAEWCKSRRGSLSVCEGQGATWLPFQEIGKEKTASNTKRPINFYGTKRQGGLFD